jgi:hypothetical protein
MLNVNWQTIFIGIFFIVLLLPVSTISGETLPPKKQIENGIEPTKVTCNDGLELMFKFTNNSPACVKPNSKIKLIEQGWGIVSIFCIDINGNNRDDIVLVPIKQVFTIGERVKADIINCGTESYTFPGTDYSMMIESMDGSIVDGACVAGESIETIRPYEIVSGQIPHGSPPCDHSQIVEGEYWLYLDGTDSKGKYKIKYENP